VVKLVEKIESFLKPFRHLRIFPETTTSEFSNSANLGFSGILENSFPFWGV